MATFGATPSNAPTFGQDSEGSLGSLDGLVPIQAGAGGASLKLAVPCASGPMVGGGSPPATQDSKYEGPWDATRVFAAASA